MSGMLINGGLKFVPGRLAFPGKRCFREKDWKVGKTRGTRHMREAGVLLLRANPPLPLLFSLGLVPEILLLDEALEQRKQRLSSISERLPLFQPNLRQTVPGFYTQRKTD